MACTKGLRSGLHVLPLGDRISGPLGVQAAEQRSGGGTAAAGLFARLHAAWTGDAIAEWKQLQARA